MDSTSLISLWDYMDTPKFIAIKGCRGMNRPHWIYCPLAKIRKASNITKSALTEVELPHGSDRNKFYVGVASSGNRSTSSASNSTSRPKLCPALSPLNAEQFPTYSLGV